MNADMYAHTQTDRQTDRQHLLICTHHTQDLWVDGICQDTLAGANELQHLAKSSPLDLFATQLSGWVRKVKEITALVNLLEEQGLHVTGDSI